MAPKDSCIALSYMPMKRKVERQRPVMQVLVL